MANHFSRKYYPYSYWI